MSPMDLAELREILRQAMWEHGVTEVLKVLAEVSRGIRDEHRPGSVDALSRHRGALLGAGARRVVAGHDASFCVWEELVKTLDQAIRVTNPPAELADTL